MLKKIAKRIHKEIIQANDYMEQAFVTKDKCPSLSDNFATLSEEELVHAEKLIREGKKLVDSHNTYAYNKMDSTMSDEEWKKKCQTIWEWQSRLAIEEINECRYKLAKYKGV